MEANELNKSSIEEMDLNVDSKSENSDVASNNESDNTLLHKHNSDKHQDNESTSIEKEDKDYSALSRELLLHELKNLIQENSAIAIKGSVDKIQHEFEKQTQQAEESGKAKYLESGLPEEEFKPEPDKLKKEFFALVHEYRNKKDEERLTQEQEKERNLKTKYEVIEGIKDLLNRQESLNETFHEFRALQQKWREIGPVPQNKLHDLWETFHLHVENFYNYIKINNELRDLDLKKNSEHKITLCEKAEALLLEPSAIKAFKSLQKLHDQWREIGPVSNDKKDELWERFKAATAIINHKQQEHFESLKDQLKRNLEAKTELCEKAESLVEGSFSSPRDWENKSKQLIDLQQVWKTIGFAPKKENNLVYERFRKACDDFFNKKRDFFKSYKDDQHNNLQLKTELCIQAEAMKESADWKKNTDEFIRIQKKWKDIGPVPRKQSDVVWKRFREACDYFFERKSHFFSHIDEEQDKNLKLKEAIIEELKAFEMQEDTEKCFALLQQFQHKWSEIGFVPLQEKEKINQEFRNLINQKFDHLNLDETSRNIQKFRNKLENWKTNNEFNEKIGQERNRLVIKLKQLEGDIILWENNIGFFAKSKNSDALIRDFNNKIDSGKQNIELLNKKLDLINDML